MSGQSAGPCLPSPSKSVWACLGQCFGQGRRGWGRGRHAALSSPSPGSSTSPPVLTPASLGPVDSLRWPSRLTNHTHHTHHTLHRKPASLAWMGVAGAERVSPSQAEVPRSPSNYCRVATCEQLHIHDLTPKCLETFAPSSTCSSCQTCAHPHIGPNHDQVLLVGRLLKQLPLLDGGDLWDCPCRLQSATLLLQWPVPEYRPQNSPDHLYKSVAF